MNIEENKRYAENERSSKARLDYVNAVNSNNNKMNELMEQYSFFERYFSFEPYKELYKKTKEWIEQKAKQWDLTRDRGMSR